MVDQGDFITEHISLIHVVGRHDDRCAELATQLAYVIPDGVPTSGVETFGRLIHEDDGRAMQRTLGDLKTTDHAAGIVSY